MNAKVGSLSGNPACEAGKLIVEVIGKDHPPEQRVVIYDETDHELQEWLTQQVKQELVADSRRSSTLHIWDWQQQPKRHLWLEIEAERGSPIRVPLMDDTRATPRQRERQWNCIVPAVPMSTMLGISANHQHREYPVHVRPGFIYLFYRGKVWRELEIRQAEGQVTYHDVRLSDFRNGDRFRDGARTASGKGLSEIWLPARWNNRAAPDIEIGYAEVQWPAVRLNAMERNARLRRARCNRLGLAVAERSFGNTTYRASSQQQAFYLQNVPAHRPREPAREWLFDQPLKYLHDLSGQYPVQSQQYAQQVHQRHERGESNPGPTHPQQTQDDLRPETGAWAVELGDTLQNLQHVCSATNEREHWQAAAAETDMLATVKKRHIAGVLVVDGLYRMRHLLARTNQAQAVLQLCAQRATFHPHHASALLIQRMMVPPHIGGQSNPLHRFISQVSQEGRQQIDLCSGQHARQLAMTCLKAAQDNLAAWLEQAANQHALGDHFCLEGLDYAGAFQLCSQLFVCLARTADQQDPFLAAGDAPRRSAGRTLLCKIAQSASQPLHRMLWPEADDDTLLKPYQAVQTPNNGEGHYRAEALNQVAQLNAPPGEEPATLEGNTLAGLMQQPDFLLLPSAKSGAAALINVWENLTSAQKEAQKGLTSASAGHQQATTESRRSRVEAHDREGDLRHEQERGNVLKEELGKEAFPAKYRMYTKDLQLLRSMLQQDFGDMVFVPHNAVNQEKYYFFGLSDLPVSPQQARQIFGKLLNLEGRLLGLSDEVRANRAGIDQFVEELLLLAIPKNHRTARLIRELNRQIAEELRIQNDLQQARERREAARSRLSEANNTLKQAQERLAQQERGWRRSSRGVPSSKAFPAGVLILEVFNVQAEFEARDATIRNKGESRSAVGLISAATDLLLAMEFLANKVAHNHPRVQTFQKRIVDRVLFNPGSGLQKLFGGRLVSVTGKLAFQTFAGTLFIGISIYDAMHEASLGDDAAWGYGLMAVGGLVGVVGGFFTASGATFLGLGPVGWTTLLLILAGGALVWWLDDSPIEEWLTNGPFGSNRSAKVPHLWNDPQEAFYRLVSLFAGIRIRIGANPEQARHSGAMGLLDPAEYHAMRRANTLVRIESNLPGLATTLGSANIHALSQLRSSNHRLSPRDMMQSSSHSLSPIQPLAQRLYPDALELFYEVPVSQSMPRTPPHRWQTYTLAVRAQIIVQGENQTWVFPAPAPTDVLRYDSERHREPVFSQAKQPFWANEQTHPDSQP
ncbi:hypothetical protein CXK91_07445 [Stutzerimonas stutzeri]|uniref:Uncharacterized protein n=1 Tax=Stutzerimonas stutzeri TaxID=316 RepID=A0A2S4AP76_STUST|nr:hypothetical protein [Stutzerimonas stutzeri]MCQ4263171.1 hypothetical protein [Stutzerimonas stutzeri]POH83062.1 hypothetical protein CXK91_07445 [Stutzerimonas stutzeri]